MKLLLLITILCPIALIYLIPKYLKLREKYINLEENSVSLKKYQALQKELRQLKELMAKKEDK
ncbi:MAG: hypothetical protein H6Q17_238 [Bacteroidetes bacterium]|jgi:hypothetical protein|nr:hypothetical protein [Bacteroidota bacterium]